MRLLITGGAGFIGSNFIRYILNARPEVAVINLDKLTYAGNLENLTGLEENPRYTFVHGDIGDRRLVSEIFSRGVDAVINFAAESHVDRSIMDATPFIETNIRGTQVLLDVATEWWREHTAGGPPATPAGPVLERSSVRGAPTDPPAGVTASTTGDNFDTAPVSGGGNSTAGAAGGAGPGQAGNGKSRFNGDSGSWEHGSTISTKDLPREDRGQPGTAPAVAFIQISTDEVYGSLGPEGRFTEESPLNPSSPYSASKAAADLLALAYHRTHGLPVAVTRCSNNYGPYQFPEKLIPLMITNALENRPLPVYGDGLNVRDWLHVEDHCRALELVLYRGRAGEIYNIGGHGERTNLAVVRTILHLLDKPAGLIRFVKDRPGHDRRYAIDPSKITRELGWQPRHTFERGLAATVEWYVKNRPWWERIKSGAYREYYERMYGGR